MSAGADALPRPRGTATSRVRMQLASKIGLGGLLVASTILVGALNTGNNLLYLLSALLLGLYPVSAALASRGLGRVEGELLLPPEAPAGRPVDVAVRLEGGDSRGVAGLVVELCAADGGRVGEDQAVRPVPWLAPNERLTLRFRLVPGRRGRRRLDLRLSTAFPFGIVRVTRRDAGGELLVLPRPDDAWRRPLELAAAPEGAASRRRGRGDDLLEIREYRSGDDARAMDWKATARLQRPMMREHAQEESRVVVLAVDPGRPATPGSEGAGTAEAAGTAAADEAVERAISRAAGAARDLAREGWRLRLVTPDRELSAGGARDVLRALALLELRDTPLPVGWWSARAAALEPGAPCLAFSASGDAASRGA